MKLTTKKVRIGGPMKTVTFLFLLGVLMSCASHHHDRKISSQEEEKKVYKYYDRVVPSYHSYDK